MAMAIPVSVTVSMAADDLPQVSAEGLELQTPDMSRMIAQSANRATNKAAADRILREWASALRLYLDAAQGRTPGK